MAEWKKVIVSGSNISQLVNDSGYLTHTSAPNGFASASFNGINLVADSLSDTLNFASSSAQGLTISANAGTDTLTFGLSAIPNTSLANSTFNVGAGNGLTGGGSTSLGGTSTVTVGAGTHITVNADDVAVNTATLTPAISGSIFSRVSGDVTISTAGVATIAANSVALGTDTTGNYVASLGAGTGTTVGGTTGEAAVPTVNVTYGSLASTAVQGNVTLEVLGTTNEVEVTNGTAAALGANRSITVGLPNDVTITNNLTVGGNLRINGAVTQVNTTNLEVEDTFILLNSGSAVNTDSGIIFGGTNGVAQSGTGLVWDASYNTNDGRLGIVSTIASNATGAQTMAYYVGGVFEGTVANAATAQADHNGNIRIEAGDIFIYA